MSQPNVLYIFADQWRAQALGYAGDPNVRTPCLDALAGESICFSQAVSGVPVCCPARATLLSGQRPLTHGVIVNDVCLPLERLSIADRFGHAGHDTAYIGKWHIDGHGRKSFIPPERHRGFAHWQVCECSHDYNDSPYYEGASAERQVWSGYDAAAQTDAACDYLRRWQAEGGRRPFLLMLAWGPPHDPYNTAPSEFRAMYDPERLQLRPNVPAERAAWARKALAGYYAHCSALDSALERLLATLDAEGLAENTILVFTTDHGDMLGSQGETKKQRPWEESIRIPFLLRWPGGLGTHPWKTDALLDVIDHQPTLLDLCGIPCDDSLEGRSFAGLIRERRAADSDDAVLLSCPHPCGEFRREAGGREYRGLRTPTHTYVETLSGPWLLYDNLEDPFQMNNLVNEDPGLRDGLSLRLHQMLEETGDGFEPGEELCKRFGHILDATGTVPYSD